MTMNQLIFLVILTIVAVGLSSKSHADELDEPICKVRVCNKIERFSLDLFSHVKDSMGEVCDTIIIPQSQLGQGVGQVLNSESRWYQGSSINPTKKSVTRIQEIIRCK
ncbi:hypothetical protein AAGG91_002747 [Salmonella enterica]|uniref:hypothetical protein n=1 Tax=Salmonella enterica TaxID=28901 RepID=UPI000FDFA6BC|nr:hypothetical protein CPT_Munch_518 [Salmonella phage Munch]EHX8550733.1 hypothetical protein [Salmonella enterica]ELL7856365.1 hypothetical protein [Salmonella enterica]EME3782952.1 hypothetical protein [Salmonella enterica]MCP0435483.1 hypothetical protein [Salmonella enterica subsp. enterica serovar Mbandaka]